ncbi:MAG TPA: hypothetical protein VIL18_08770 [Longimicrobiales bacterium]
MVRRHWSAGRRAVAAALGLVALTVGCRADDIVVPESDEPFLFLVLNWRTLSNYDLETFSQHALLITAGSPDESPRYRSAQRFEMRRASDGALFDWRAHTRLYPEASGSIDFIELNWANYYLPQESSGNGLAYRDLEPGETYELEIETEGVVLRGRATIPESFTVSILVQDGRRIAVWPRVRGAGGYIVGVEGELQPDTTYVIPADVPAGALLQVRALDENLYRYLADDRVGRSGIDRGYGVFGAVVFAETTVPERP